MENQVIMERTGTTATVCGLNATIPDDISIFVIFAKNPFIPNGDYREDGWIYVDNKPIKKWFKNINNISVWFPILSDLHKLQKRYYEIHKKYEEYLKNEYKHAFDELIRVKKAHTQISHKYQGNCDPWWFYESDKYANQEGITWDWVKTPDNPINLEIGNAYYKAEQRLMQLGQRSYKFRTIFEYAINMKIAEIEGDDGQILQFKIGDKIYWFQKYSNTWNKLAFPENEIKIVNY